MYCNRFASRVTTTDPGTAGRERRACPMRTTCPPGTSQWDGVLKGTPKSCLYTKIKDHDGVWKMVVTKQHTKADAVRWAAEKEAEMANVDVGLRPANEKTFTDAPDYWLKTYSQASWGHRRRIRAGARDFASAAHRSVTRGVSIGSVVRMRDDQP